MLNSLTYSLPEKLENAVQKEFGEWQKENKIARVWQKDAAIWTNEDEARWLGWLDSVEVELSKIQEYKDFAADVKSAGFTDVLLMGNGRFVALPGSSFDDFRRGKFSRFGFDRSGAD